MATTLSYPATDRTVVGMQGDGMSARSPGRVAMTIR